MKDFFPSIDITIAVIYHITVDSKCCRTKVLRKQLIRVVDISYILQGSLHNFESKMIQRL